MVDESRELKVVVDLGGSYIRAGVAVTGSASPEVVEETPPTAESIVDAVRSSVKAVLASHDAKLESLLLACPGLVDPLGNIHKSLYLPIGDLRLRERLESQLDAPAMVVNDANSQAVGARKDGESLAYIVVGTGVGGAFVEGGNLVVGSQGFAGEIGHAELGRSPSVCRCGQPSCLDVTASGFALERELGEAWWQKPSDSHRARVLKQAGRDVGRAAALCAILLNPDRVLVAGRVVGQQSFLNGLMDGWRSKGWANCVLEHTVDTWPQAVRGLIEIYKHRKE